MSSNEPMAGMSMAGAMRPYFHFGLGDAILFREWVPMSGGASFGACVGLFLLAMVDRLLAAFRGIMQAWWAKKWVSSRSLTFTSVC